MKLRKLVAYSVFELVGPVERLDWLVSVRFAVSAVRLSFEDAVGAGVVVAVLVGFAVLAGVSSLTFD